MRQVYKYMGSELVRLLPWDTEFFGVRIATITAPRLNEEDLSTVLKTCFNDQIDCLYYLADSDDHLSVPLAQQHGFEFVDIKLTMQRSLEGVAASSSAKKDAAIRAARNADIAALKAIASTSYGASRYYFDERFAPERCDALYETWIEKSVNGYADAVFVIDSNGEPIGYISCHLDEGDGRIGLVGVDPRHRGQGLGALLIDKALGYFEAMGMENVTVVTQGRNIGAQRLYQQRGFRTHSVQLWYHRWF